MTERQWIERLTRRVPHVAGSGVVLGIGDDCAIVRQHGAREDLLFTTDLSIEGVHFRRGDDAESVGHRVLARGLSDIAAMGGKPRFCLLSIARPRRITDGQVARFYRGLLRLARETGTELAGGDMGAGRQLTFDIVVGGTVPRGRALRRDGAKPGDWVYCSGPLGRAAALRYPAERFSPKIELGRLLLGTATACMDLTDGLALDLHRMCRASRCSAQLDRIPVATGASLDEALHGGEDYELLFTAPGDVPGMQRMGRMVSGTPGAVFFNGEAVPAKGYDHFAHGRLKSFSNRVRD